MGNAGGQELVGFIWQVLNHKMLHLKKKFLKFLKLEGMHSQDRNQS